MKFIIIFFLISFEVFCVQYTPRTYQEELNYIRLKNKKFRVGIINSKLNEEVLNNRSLNSLSESFFKDYLKLNVEFYKGSESDIQKSFIDNNLDVVALIKKGSINDEDTLYSEDIKRESNILNFGVKSNNKNLLDLINSGLRDNYNLVFNEFSQDKLKELKKSLFIESLTEEEKKFFIQKENRNLKIAYIECESLSHYSHSEEKFIGRIPEIIKILKKDLDFQIIEIKTKSGDYEEVYNLFLKKKINMIVTSACKDEKCLEKNSYILSKELFKIPIYEIYNNIKLDVNESKVGIAKNSLESIGVKDILVSQNIKYYSSRERVMSSFLNNTLKSIVLLDINKINKKNIRAKIIGNMSISFGFPKEDLIKRDLFNKILEYYIDFEEIEDSVEKYKNEIVISKNIENKNYILLSKISLVLLLLMIIVMIIKRNKNFEIEKQITFDTLTGLFSRVIFNRFCEDFKSKKGVAVLIDLDNFKYANDNYGHHIGDEILVEYAKIIKKVFRSDHGEKNIFRISGDEFYCFIEKSDYQLVINELKKELNESDILKKYSIGSSIGIYKKKEKETIEQSFMYADVGMCKAKNEKGHIDYFVENGEILKDSLMILLKKILKNDKYRLRSELEIENDLVNVGILKIKSNVILESEILGEVRYKDFIEVSKEMKIIKKVDLKVLKIILKDTFYWKEKNNIKKEIVVEINLHLRTFGDKSLWKDIDEIVSNYKKENIKIKIIIIEDGSEILIERLFNNLYNLKNENILFDLNSLKVKTEKGRR